MTPEAVERFFGRYERFFTQSLAGEVDGGEMAALYAPAFIAASPLGVMAGRNDGTFHRALSDGYAQYRAIGTIGMRVRGVTLSPIDRLHAVAHVDWTATYGKPGQPPVDIDFTVHYLMQEWEGHPRIFGWISGDEQALLRQHGIIP